MEVEVEDVAMACSLMMGMFWFFYVMQCNVMQYIRLWIMMKAGKFGQGVFPSVPSSLSFF